MADKWLPLNSIPGEGQTFVEDDPSLWQEPLAEFGMDCRVVVPLRGELFVLRVDGGCLVRGRLTGEVSLPCDRCSEAVRVLIDSRFENFEPLPPEDAAPEQDFSDETDAEVIRAGVCGPEINFGALLWQEFVLALPSKPLCSPDCRGLCPKCGGNRNTQDCACPPEEGDPRLAALRKLKITN